MNSFSVYCNPIITNAGAIADPDWGFNNRPMFIYLIIFAYCRKKNDPLCLQDRLDHLIGSLHNIQDSNIQNVPDSANIRAI